MSQNIGTLITAPIRPNDSLDLIASAFQNEIMGGLHSYGNTTERDALIQERRKAGMVVYVSATTTYYSLGSGLTNSDWTVFSSGSGSGNFLNISGGTVTGQTLFNAGLLSNTFSATTITGQTIYANSLTATTLSGGTILSGSTNLYDIFVTSANIVHTKVQNGTNITTGGTADLPTVNLVASPSINGLTFSGTAIGNAFSANTISGGTILSGNTNLYNIFMPLGVPFLTGMGTSGRIPVWGGPSYLTDSILEQSGTGVTVNGSVNIIGDVNVLGTASTFNTQVVQSLDNNILLNYSGTYISAIGGGITVLSGQPSGVASTWSTDVNGAWSANTQIIAGGGLNVNTGTTLSSGGTDLYNIFATTVSLTHTAVQNGINIITGGTAALPTVNLVSSPSVDGFLFSGSAIGNAFSANTISGGTILSGSTNLYDIFATSASIDYTNVQNGTNIITGGTASDPTVNLVASPSINGLTFSGTAIGNVFSASTLSAGTMISGSTNLYDIFATTVSLTHTAVQNGVNIITGGTAALPTVNLVASPSIDNLSFSGNAIGGTLSANTVNGGTILSGNTNLYAIFATPSSIINTKVQNGTNIITGGTASLPTINLVASPSVDGLLFSGTSIGNNFSANTISGGTILSGSTNLYDIFTTGAHTAIQNGTNIITGGTAALPTVNLVASPSINSLTFSGTAIGGGLSANTLSGGTILSGSTNLYDIFLTLANSATTGNYIPLSGTNGNPVTGDIEINDSVNLSWNAANETFQYNPGSTNLEITTSNATDFVTGAILSAGTDLYAIFGTGSGGTGFSGWTASTGLNSIIANNGTPNLASGAYSIVGGKSNTGTNAYSTVVNGKFNQTPGGYSFIGNGFENSATSWYSTIVNGANNISSGQHSFVGAGDSNTASGHYSFIGTGLENKVLDNYSFIGGGNGNIVKGKYSSIVGGEYNYTSIFNKQFIGGGISNSGQSGYAVIVGGKYNVVSGYHGAVLNGRNNLSSGQFSSVIGGSGHTVSGNRSIIIGGANITGTSNDTVYVPFFNIKSANTNNVLTNVLVRDSNGDIYLRDAGSLSGGTSGGTGFSGWTASTGLNSIIANNETGNIASGNYSIIGGSGNTGSGYHTVILNGEGNLTTGYNSTILNGKTNTAYGYYSLIGGGSGHYTYGLRTVILNGQSNSAMTESSFIGLGFENKAYGALGHSIIAGGYRNKNAGGFSFMGVGHSNKTTGDFSSILNGRRNYASGAYSFIGGGGGYFSANANSATTNFATIINGQGNVASGTFSFIGNGSGHTVSGHRSAIIGGHSITGISNDTVYVPFLNVNSASTNNALTNILVRDSNGDIYLRDASTLSGGTSGATGNFLPISGGTVTGDTIFTTNVSASTLTLTTTNAAAPLNFPIFTSNPSSPIDGDAWILSALTGNALFSVRIGGLTKTVELT